MEWAAIWALVKRFWPYGVIAVLAFLVYDNHKSAIHFKDQYELCQQARKTDAANFKAAASKAADQNKADVLATERKWQAVVQQKDADYNANIKSANARIADYISRMQLKPTGAYSGSTGQGGVSSAPQPTGVTDGTRAGTVVPVPENDLYICAANTIKAQTWQDFWNKVTAAQPAETTNEPKANQ